MEQIWNMEYNYSLKRLFNFKNKIKDLNKHSPLNIRSFHFKRMKFDWSLNIEEFIMY